MRDGAKNDIVLYRMIFQICIGPDMFSWIRHYVAEVCAPPSALLVIIIIIIIVVLPIFVKRLLKNCYSWQCQSALVYLTPLELDPSGFLKLLLCAVLLAIFDFVPNIKYSPELQN